MSSVNWCAENLTLLADQLKFVESLGISVKVEKSIFFQVHQYHSTNYAFSFLISFYNISDNVNRLH